MNENNKNGNSQKREAVTYTDYSIFKGNVRLVGEGPQPIVIDRDAAIEMAKKRGMNLVQIAYNKNDFPRSVCKIMDYSRFKYEQKKREKEMKKKQREATAEIKEIKFSIRIDEGDLNTKINKIRELLEDGDKVKLTIRMSRREMQRTDLARDTLGSVLKKIADVTEMDQHPSLVGNLLYCVVRKRK
jgi:translation initiation factor IF-3